MAEYCGKYPRSGDVALLCEGDLIGYEAQLFGRWTVDKLGTRPLVDIWPCGTAKAIFGMSDAVGRARPIVVIEDRDFRTEPEAGADCKAHQGDRKRRDVQVLGWYSWKRAEIENYLLEPEVLLPVMTDAFGCPESHVQEALTEIIPALVVFQATQYALYRARMAWDSSDPDRNNLRSSPQAIPCRPRWTGGQPKVAPPDMGAVREQLKQNVETWQACFVSGDGTSARGLQGTALVPDFEAKCAEWGRTGLADPVWRTDWAGKEILQWLLRWLTGTCGWRDAATGTRSPIKWDVLKRKEADAREREVVDTLRPFLRDRFLEHLRTLKVGSIFDEWREIETALRRAMPPA